MTTQTHFESLDVAYEALDQADQAVQSIRYSDHPGATNDVLSELLDCQKQCHKYVVRTRQADNWAEAKANADVAKNWAAQATEAARMVTAK